MKDSEDTVSRFSTVVKVIFTLFFFATAFAVNVPLSLFSLGAYQQNIAHWLPPESPDYNKEILSRGDQQKRLAQFRKHLYSSDSSASSPWSSGYVKKILDQQQDLHALEVSLIAWYSNQDKDPAHIGYASNFRPYSAAWIKSIQRNMQLTQLNKLAYSTKNRAITLTNLDARILPTADPHYYNFTQAGQGYPFDNLQMSSLWAATPIYIVSETLDKAWSLVITPSFIAWVPSNSIARVDGRFIREWQQISAHAMAAAVRTQSPIVDSKKNFLFFAYIGAVFPLQTTGSEKLIILVPKRGNAGYAISQPVTVNRTDFAPMPLAATRHNFARLFASLKNRPYGWGGMNFYNDCSQELKSLFAPFALWLPRHSSEQVKAGKMVDKSNASQSERLQYLKNQGHPLLTVVYIGGHILLYIGNYANPQSPGTSRVMTYQNLWGLAPADRSRRTVVGGSVFLPLLIEYPQDPGLVSLANQKYFQVVFLDQSSTENLKATTDIRLKPLVYPTY